MVVVFLSTVLAFPPLSAAYYTNLWVASQLSLPPPLSAHIAIPANAMQCDTKQEKLYSSRNTLVCSRAGLLGENVDLDTGAGTERPPGGHQCHSALLLPVVTIATAQ